MKIAIDQIDFTKNYEGYYWLSNKPVPEIVDGPIDSGIFDKSLFIVEAAFYCAENNTSIQIKHVGDDYLTHKYDLSSIAKEHCDNLSYFAHDLDGIRKYKMLEAWELTTDPLIDDCQVLRPTWSAFIGFVKQ